MNDNAHVQTVYGRPLSDALSLEYKRDYGCASGQLELSDLVNNPTIAGEFRRLGLRLHEETLRLLLGDSYLSERPEGSETLDSKMQA